MRIANVLLWGKLEWLVRRDDPATIDVGGGWGVVNPLVPEIPLDPEGMVISFSSESVFASLNSLSLVVPSWTTNEDLDEVIPSFLQRLRVVTRQPRAPTAIGMRRLVDIDALTAPMLPDHPQKMQVQLLRNTERTAATMRLVAETLRNRGAPPPPVYASLVLDAIAAKWDDPRRTILYSAFAAEILAASVIDDAYAAAIESSSPSGRFRFVRVTLPGGIVVLKDPVFDLLQEVAKHKFKRFLHELPLYALGRSLLEDDENLYRRALEIQATRNAIAHTGFADYSRAELIPVDSNGAQEALEVVRRVFKWFGVEDYFVALDVPPDNT